ncbi:hypothetical protein [Streptosporangium canum]|uniref:hypothetical protein n=1 Tax=Streptosporangium canum TaxID=324952 RepID=UPI0037889E80
MPPVCRVLRREACTCQGEEPRDYIWQRAGRRRRRAAGFFSDHRSHPGETAPTLTSGVFEEPTPGGAFGALVNAGLEAFVQAAAIEMPRGLRVNSVSPGWVTETLRKMGSDGAGGTPAKDVARAYVEIVEGTAQGRTVTPSAL